MTRKTVLVVPCYNEESRLPIAAFERFASARPHIGFVMVDDGSEDRTADVLHRLAASHPGRFQVLRLATNSGKAEAVRVGIVHAIRAGADYVGFIDADLAAPLEEVPQMIDVLDRHDHVHVVIGSRLPLAGRRIRRRLLRRVLGGCFAAVAASVLGLPIRDTQCGLKLFRGSAATLRLFAEPFRSRWIFDVEVLARLIADQGRAAAIEKVYEKPLDHWAEVAGSKLKTGDFTKAAGELVGIYATYVRSRKPRHLPLDIPLPAGASRCAA